MENKINVRLNIKPIPVPIIYQPIYKLIMLLGILKFGTGASRSSSFLKLHLYMWGLRSDENIKILYQLKSKERNTILPWSFEPGLNKTITLAIINNYCEREMNSTELKIKITKEGEDFVKKIDDLNIFSEDFLKLKSVGNIPQKTILNANNNWILNI